MKFIPTLIEGLMIIEVEPIRDERGCFYRTYCRETLKGQGIDFNVLQCSVSNNKLKGTIRGMHYQEEPFAESKLVRCTSGKIYDVILDIRKESSTFLKWVSVELTPTNNREVYIPKGLAHGFQTLEDNSEVFYMMDENYHAQSARGVRWNDPVFNIVWPLPCSNITKKDSEYTDFSAKGC